MLITDTDDKIIEKAPTHFGKYRLESVFQPIFGLSHRRAVGFEALVRARTRDNEPVSPIALFETAKGQAQTRTLDRICQRLHVHSFAHQAPADRWLFLNLDTETITRRSYKDGFLARAMAAEALPPHRLVVEITEGAIRDEAVLIDAVEHFRSLGALVALDDFGAGHSNFDRIWRLAPDIIKLDRSIIVQAGQHAQGRLRRMLPNLVAMMHEAGSMVLAEGVETQEQGLIALDADIDFVQGFYLARPAPRISDFQTQVPRLDRLTAHFTDTALDQDREDRQALAPYLDVFRAVAEAIDQGRDIAQTCQSLLTMPRTLRCYLLDARGEQLMCLASPRRRFTPDVRSAPIADAADGAWFRRPYFRSALNEPRRMQISRPYLSTTSMHMCVTLSVANGTGQVFCCDIEW